MAHDERWEQRATEFSNRFPRAYKRAQDSTYIYHGLNVYAHGDVELDEMIDRLLVALDEEREAYRNLVETPSVAFRLMVKGEPGRFDNLIDYLRT